MAACWRRCPPDTVSPSCCFSYGRTSCCSPRQWRASIPRSRRPCKLLHSNSSRSSKSTRWPSQHRPSKSSCLPSSSKVVQHWQHHCGSNVLQKLFGNSDWYLKLEDDLSMFPSTAPQQQVIVQDSKMLQHMNATGMVRRHAHVCAKKDPKLEDTCHQI